jgi:hypothetical protein
MGSSRRHAIFCSICGCVTATLRLREAEQVTSLCPACRETMRRLNVARERDAGREE